MNARQSVGAPAPTQDTAAQPFIFEWYENRIQRDLQTVYRNDQPERQKIFEIIEEMTDSHLFWKLIARYTDAHDTAPDEQGRHAALMALLARIYIAGTLRGFRVIE